MKNNSNYWDVFISYKAEERLEASWLKNVFEENGLSCWMAPESIPGGSSYADEIEDAIKNCGVFVLVLSQKAQESKWVKKELDMALNHEKVILPFMIENCQLQKAFNYYLTDVQRYHAYAGKSDAVRAMLERINAVLNNGSGNTVLPKDKSPIEKKKHYLRSAFLLVPYIVGLFLPLILYLINVEFSFLLRIVYFIWIVFGAYWIWNQIETRLEIASLCFGTLSEADLKELPADVFSKIVSVFGKGVYISNDCPKNFKSYYKLKRMEFGSWDGEKVNYLKIDFKRGFEYYDPSVFYLHSLSKGGQAVKMLIHQGFVLEAGPVGISPKTDYLVKGLFHVCLYYKKKHLSSVVVYNCSDEDFNKHFRGEDYEK